MCNFSVVRVAPGRGEGRWRENPPCITGWSPQSLLCKSQKMWVKIFKSAHSLEQMFSKRLLTCSKKTILYLWPHGRSVLTRNKV